MLSKVNIQLHNLTILVHTELWTYIIMYKYGPLKFELFYIWQCGVIDNIKTAI